jgi:hypothetical protein
MCVEILKHQCWTGIIFCTYQTHSYWYTIFLKFLKPRKHYVLGKFSYLNSMVIIIGLRQILVGAY